MNDILVCFMTADEQQQQQKWKQIKKQNSIIVNVTGKREKKYETWLYST